MNTDINNQDAPCPLEKLAATAVRLRESTNRLDQLRKALWIVHNSKAFNEWYDSQYK